LLFSSRRRHTILVSDWSSDVCSSDLLIAAGLAALAALLTFTLMRRAPGPAHQPAQPPAAPDGQVAAPEPATQPSGPSRPRLASRSEERRVGKEGRLRRSADHTEKKEQ